MAPSESSKVESLPFKSGREKARPSGRAFVLMGEWEALRPRCLVIFFISNILHTLWGGEGYLQRKQSLQGAEQRNDILVM